MDVGANGGAETRAALNVGLSVVAVECLPEAYEHLAKMFHSVATRVRLLHACASDRAGSAQLHRAGDSSSMNPSNVASGVELLKAKREPRAASVVRTVVLDDELRGVRDVRLVKLHVHDQMWLRLRPTRPLPAFLSAT